MAFSEKLNFNVKKVIASNFVAFTEYMNFRFGCNMFFKIPKQKNANFEKSVYDNCNPGFKSIYADPC